MIYGVISDIHSNLEALSAVLARFDQIHVDGYICCGDLVGYGADPNLCLEKIRTLKNSFVICGNHDLAVIGEISTEFFNQYARAAVLWTQQQLSPENRRFLMSLTPRLQAQHFTLAHGSPRNPSEEYLLSPGQFKENIPYVKDWPLFIGHSHMPLLFRFMNNNPNKVESVFLDKQAELLPRDADGSFKPVALNPGSVGQPRDQDRRASCGLYDSDKGTFQVMRVSYDVGGAQAKIRAAGLPEYLALRLDFGQ